MPEKSKKTKNSRASEELNGENVETLNGTLDEIISSVSARDTEINIPDIYGASSSAGGEVQQELLVPDVTQVSESQLSDLFSAVTVLNRQVSPLTYSAAAPRAEVEKLSDFNILQMGVGRIIETYFRHRWLNILPILLMLIAGVLYLVFGPVEYKSSGVFYVQGDSILESIAGTGSQAIDFDFRSPSQKTAEELNELLKTNNFLVTIISQTVLREQLENPEIPVLETLEEVREGIQITGQGKNQVYIDVRWEDPETAFQLSDAIVNTYLQWLIQNDRQDSDSALQFFEELLPEYQNARIASQQEVEQFLRDHPEPIRGDRPALEQYRLERLQANYQVAEQRYNETLGKLDNAKLNVALAESSIRQNYRLLDEPKVPEEPEQTLTDIAIEMAIFITVGLVLSVLLVLGSTLLDKSLRFPIDARYALQAPVLTAVVDADNLDKRRWWQRRRE